MLFVLFVFYLLDGAQDCGAIQTCATGMQAWTLPLTFQNSARALHTTTTKTEAARRLCAPENPSPLLSPLLAPGFILPPAWELEPAAEVPGPLAARAAEAVAAMSAAIGMTSRRWLACNAAGAQGGKLCPVWTPRRHAESLAGKPSSRAAHRAIASTQRLCGSCGNTHY